MSIWKSVVVLVYDYIIGGSGIAGCVCAYLLSKKGYKCLILEQEKGVHEKVCGGGVSIQAIGYLCDLGIDVTDIDNNLYTKVVGYNILRNETLKIKYFSDEYAIGISRQVFDSFLLRQAQKEGASVKYGEKISNVLQDDRQYIINGYVAKHFVCAIGAIGITSLSKKINAGQSFGLSSIIEGASLLREDLFHFLYYDNLKSDRYFWLFPIGKNTWNIGVWTRYPKADIMLDYQKYFQEYMKVYFENTFAIKQKVRGAYLGHTNQCNIGSLHLDAIGDYAGTCGINSGGGIHWAIKSAMDYVARQ